MGAWIETIIYPVNVYCKGVAPRVGAWIETSTRLVFVTVLMSHPVWVRGLKPLLLLWTLLVIVAPRVGAWIETVHPFITRFW